MVPLVPLLFGITANILIEFPKKLIKLIVVLGFLSNIYFTWWQMTNFQEHKLLYYLRSKQPNEI